MCPEAHTVHDVRAGIQFTQQHAFRAGGAGSGDLRRRLGRVASEIAISGIDERTETKRRGAGEEWDSFVATAVARNCAGVECLSGIPGSVGGTPVQNVGAYGQEVSETIQSVLALDLRDGQLHELCNDACGFSYRTSIFNTSQRGRYISSRHLCIDSGWRAAQIALCRSEEALLRTEQSSKIS